MIQQRVERMITIPNGMVVVPEDDERRVKLDIKLAETKVIMQYEEEGNGTKEKEKIQEESKSK